MGACEYYLGSKDMSVGAFHKHIMGIVKQIKELIIEKSMEIAHEKSEHYKQRVQTELGSIEEEKAAAEARSPAQPPYPLPSDKGLSLLTSAEQKEVTKYQSDYKVNLLDFKESDIDKEKLKRDWLDWIDERFERGASLPSPSEADVHISALEKIGGSNEILEFDVTTEDGGIKVDPNKDQGTGSPLMSIAALTPKSLDMTPDSWTSGTADVFRDQFLPRIPVAASNQINVTKSIRNALAAHKAVMEKARETVDAIAHDGLDAIDGADMCECETDGKTALGLTAGVLGIVGGLAGLAAGGSGFALIAAGTQVLSGSASTIQTSIDGEASEEYDFESGTQTIVDGIVEALDKTYKNLEECYTSLSDGMKTLIEVMSRDGGVHIRAPRPGADDGQVAFADATQDDVIEAVEGA